MKIWEKIKAVFAWNSIVPFLKEIFKGIVLIVFQGGMDLALEAVKTIAAQGLPTDEAKQKAFADTMMPKLKEKGMAVGNSTLNLLRESAVAYLKNKGVI
jgi:hypothetical protein